MQGDPRVVRRRVGELAEQATGLRALADRLLARSGSVAWQGRAADALQERVHERVRRLREVAERYDDAADALRAHARAVELAGEEAAAAERRARLEEDGPAGSGAGAGDP